MKAEYKNIEKIKPYKLSVEKKFNSYIWILSFFIVSISIGFLALTLTYLFSKNWGASIVYLKIPSIFYLDTAILVLASASLLFAFRAFNQDNTNAYKLWLYTAVLSGVTFLGGQISGWFALAQTGFGITEHRSSPFLYVISGVHGLHIIGGIVFLVVIFINANNRLREPALSVVYFTDPLPKARLKLANYYWHFLGGLWLYLLIFFSIVK